MANEKYQNTSKVDTNVTAKAALVTDLDPSYFSKEQYSYARNLIRNSKEGNIGTLGNEPSTISCYSTIYPIVGLIDLPDGTTFVLSGDGDHSELGIGQPKTCTYTKLKQLDCLGLSPYNPPVKGVAKKNFQQSIVVTFTDKTSPVRRIELDKLSGITDCDDTLLWKKITQPCINITKGQVGNVPNGTFSVALAYSIDGEIFSDFYSITNRIQLYSETGANSIEVSISGIDQEFEEYVLVVVGNYIDPVTKGVTKLAKQIGTFSTSVSRVSITDFINTNYQDVPLSKLVIKRPTWQKAGIIVSNSNYLLLADLVAREEENYQLKAMSIKTEYVVDQVLADYYNDDGFDIGYYRDENYDWYIQGIYNTGEHTDAFHVGQRKATAGELALASGGDIYEYNNECSDGSKIAVWQTTNTAGRMTPLNEEFKCGRRTLGYGNLGYHQGTNRYPNNVAQFGEDANQFIRYGKMPDECKVPRFSIIDGKKYINILGVRFSNIPAFDSPDIVGYRFLRSDRKGGNGTVIARGIMTNVRSYTDSKTDEVIMYSNYNVNDLSPDQYLSSTQTAYKNGKETNFNPLTDYYKDRFNFYSPHTSFEPKYSLGTELKIESEEIAQIKGNFELVYNHPKQKLLNQFSFWLAAAVGFIESSLVLLGKGNHEAKSSTLKSIPPVPTFPPLILVNESSQEFRISSVEDLVGLDIVTFIQKKILAGDLGVFATIKNIIAALLAIGIKIPYSIFAGIKEANEIFDIINNFTGYTDYVYQYNAHADFNRSICVQEGNKRRSITLGKYIPSDVISIDEKIFNNLLGEESVYLELNKPILDPTTKDNSRNTISGFGICDDPLSTVTSTGSAYYATIKIPNPNQYGALGSSQKVSLHSCPLTGTESGNLFGGDAIIARFQIQKRKQFFNQNIAGTNYPPGTEYDYRKYRNIGYPRYWMDTTKYDFSQLLSSNVVNFTRFNRTTASKYNLDCKSGDKKSITRIDDAYMYLSSNTVLDFFVEVDYNINFREKTEHPFYSRNHTNLNHVFRADRLEFPEEFQISRAYNDIYTTEVFAQQQRSDFDPANPIPVNQPNSVIYSLPSFNLQDIDNWQYFLPANFFAFKEGDFGELTAIHKLDQDRLIFLFSGSSPYISMGRDFLELEQSGRKITIGDGGLFAQDPREIIPTDNNYGSCNSRYAFSNTHLGRYYPSERQGRILNFTESLDDVARQGVSYWCKNYMPFFLTRYFPDYNEPENPLTGIGYLTAFDSFYETIYVSKRDFSPKKEYLEDITWDNSIHKFKYKGDPIELRSKYFNDISWTLSYSPTEKAFVSWHDWHPDLVLQTDNHFMTVKGNTVWKHNEAFDSFCVFYGIEQPFEIEPISSSGQQIDIIRSIQYILEVQKYKNFGRDKFHTHHENFDRLQVWNTEQISPILEMVLGNPNPEENQDYPKKTSSLSYAITFFKEENKYTVNQFWDSVNDRGEFTNKEVHLIATDESGYKSVLNPLVIDIDKPEEQRKKFRHYFTKFRFTKTKSGANKFIFKLVNIKKLASQR